MSLSAAYTVEGSSNPARHEVSYASVVDLALTSTTGATSIVWEIMACSDPLEPIPAISLSGSPSGSLASFTMPADSGDTLGRTFLVRCTVSSQVRGANGAYESAVEYAVVGAVNSQGRLPIVPGEENYRHATHGWSPEINEILNGAGGGGGGGGGGWTDDGAIVRLTSSTDSVAIGTASLSGTEKLRVIGNSRFEQGAATSGNPKAMLVSGAGHTALTSGAEVIDVDFALNRTVQRNAGAVATQRAFIVRAPTYSFVGASTITDAATFVVSGAPTASSNATITNAYALWVQAGAVRFQALGAGVVQSSATGVLSSATLTVANGGTGITSAGGVADRVLLTTDGTTLSMGRVPVAAFGDLDALSVPGRSTNTSGGMAAITGAAGQALRVSGTTLGFGTLDLATIGGSTFLGLASLGGAAGNTGKALISNGTIWAAGTDFGSNTLITTGALRLGTNPSTTGALNLANEGGIYGRNAANSADHHLLRINNGDGVILGNSTTNTVVAGPAGGSSIRFLVNGVDAFRIGTSVVMFATNFTWDASQTNPVIGQTADASNTTTGDAFTIGAQDCAGTTTVTAGAMTLRAGDATGASGIRTGGGLTLRVGTGATAPGALAVYGGNGSTGVQLYGRNAANNADQILLQWDATTPKIAIGNNGSPASHIYLTATAVQLRYGTDYVAQCTSTGTLNLNTGNSITFNAGGAGLMQVLDTTGVSSAGAMTVHAGDATSGSGGTGGAATFRAGDATGASGTRTGGALTLRSGTGASAHGAVTIQLGSNNVFTANSGGTTAVNSSGDTRLTVGGTFIARAISGSLNVATATSIQFEGNVLVAAIDSSVSGISGTYRVGDFTGTGGGTAGAATFRAGDATGGSGSRTGGALTLRSGTGATADGDLTLERGTTTVAQWLNTSSDFVRFGASPATSGHVRVPHASTALAGLSSTSSSAALVRWGSTATDVATFGNSTYAAELLGSSIKLTAGVTLVELANLATNRDILSLCFNGTLSTTQMPAGTGDQVVYLHNATTAPSANPASGIIVYSDTDSVSGATTLLLRSSDGVMRIGADEISHLVIRVQDYPSTGTLDLIGATININSGIVSNTNGEAQILGPYVTLGTSGSGNIAVFQDFQSTNFQSATGALYISNATVNPTGNPTSGGFLYENSGSWTHRGSSGTISSWAA